MFSIQNSNKGKCLTASQDIIKGSIIIRQDPVIYSAFKDYCADCLVTLANNRFVCHSCLLEYCSEDCHLECNAEKCTLDILLYKRALKRLNDLKDLSMQGTDISNLEEIYCKIKSDTEIQIGFTEFKDLTRRISTNLIGITRDLVNVGVGIYPTASFMNHDCRENTIIEFRGREIRVKASRDIKKGEEITTRYLPIYKNRKSRMEEFRHWNFKCSCELCLFVGDSRDLVKVIFFAYNSVKIVMELLMRIILNVNGVKRN
jgi:hypothetical protein